MTTDPFHGGREDPSESAGAANPWAGYAPVVPTVGPATPTRPASPAEPRRAVPVREPPSRAPLPAPLAPTAPRPALGARHRPAPSRADDRRIAAVSIVLAAGFLVAALVSAAAGALGAAVVAPWLPLHLALAGGASTAIAGVMPFFVAALAAGAPADARLRGSAVGLVAVGAALVAVRGIEPAAAWAPVLGGVLYLAGIGAVAHAVRNSGRAGLMMRRPIVTIGYTLALVNVAVGGVLGHARRRGVASGDGALGTAAAGPRVDERHRVRVAGHRRDAAALPAHGARRADRPAPERGVRGAGDRRRHADRGRGPRPRARAGRGGRCGGGARGRAVDAAGGGVRAARPRALDLRPGLAPVRLGRAAGRDHVVRRGRGARARPAARPRDERRRLVDAAAGRAARGGVDRRRS